jgi:hypothetical protein
MGLNELLRDPLALTQKPDQHKSLRPRVQSQPSSQVKASPISRNPFQFLKFISFDFQIQIPSNQPQNPSKFKFNLFKIPFILCNVLKYVCLLACMYISKSGSESASRP